MAWKDLAERLQEDLKKSNDTIATLQRKLAESEGKRTATAHSAHGHPHAGQVQQVTDIQNELQTIRAEETVIKLQKVEPETNAEIEKLNEEIKDWEYKLRGEEETLRRVQAQRSSDQSLSARESGQQAQISKLKSDVSKANAEIERLKTINGSLTRQLEAEKRENMRRIAEMRSDPNKILDQDDEEPLPVKNPAPKALNKQTFDSPTTSPMKVFKALYIPDYWRAKKTERTPAPKKRKRTRREELDEEIADLGIEDLEAPTEPRRKKQTTRPGNFGNPMRIVDSEDEELPDPATLLKKAPSKTPIRRAAPVNSFGKATRPIGDDGDDHPSYSTTSISKIAQKKKTPKETAPPTPISPVSPTFSLPDSSDFAFKAVCTYHRNGTPHSIYHSADLQGKMDELWDRISLTTNLWEDCAGEDWRFEYEQKTRKAKLASCVTRKLLKQRTNWHRGEEGKYACKDCAKSGRPCFTYVALESDEGYEYGEFRLLPVLEGDRQRAVVKDQEVRYWVNDLVVLLDPGEMGECMESE